MDTSGGLWRNIGAKWGTPNRPPPLYCSFVLIQKNQKIKASPIPPDGLPGLRLPLCGLAQLLLAGGTLLCGVADELQQVPVVYPTAEVVGGLWVFAGCKRTQ